MAAVLAANDQTPFYPAFRSGAGEHNSIFAANDANFDAEHLSEPLSEYIVGYPDEEGLDTLLEEAAPVVEVGGRAFTYRKHESAEAFQAALNDEDVREIQGNFAQVRLTGTQANGRTQNKGLTMVLDNDQGGEDLRTQQRAVANLRARLLRAELLRLLAVLDANDVAASSTNWGAGNASADPDMEVLAEVDTSGDSRGIDSNIALYGGGAWLKRKMSYSIRDKAGAFAFLRSSEAEVAATVGVDKVLRSNFRYQTGASTKSKIINNAVWIYYAKKGLMPDDPSNIKRFVTSTPSGRWRVYITSELKRTLVTLEHYSLIECTSTLGIRQLPVTFSS